MSDTVLLRLPQVQRKIPFGRSKIYDKVARGEFPRPLKIDGCTVWVEAEIEAWVLEHIEKERSAQAKV